MWCPIRIGSGPAMPREQTFNAKARPTRIRGLRTTENHGATTLPPLPARNHVASATCLSKCPAPDTVNSGFFPCPKLSNSAAELSFSPHHKSQILITDCTYVYNGNHTDLGRLSSCIGFSIQTLRKAEIKNFIKWHYLTISKQTTHHGLFFDAEFEFLLSRIREVETKITHSGNVQPQYPDGVA